MLRRLILHIIVNIAALYFISDFLAGDFLITGGIKGYLIAALLFGFLNGIVKPILKILSLPFIFVTAGVFVLVINTFLVWFAEYALDILEFEGVTILVEGGVITYLYVGILLGVINTVLMWLLKK